MIKPTRRSVLQGGLATAALLSVSSRRLLASPLGLPIGLQLYSVREMLAKDYDGTLRQIAALGYVEVEAAGFFGRSSGDVKRSMQAARLRCVSAHYPYTELDKNLDRILTFHKEAGIHSIICSFPGFKDADRTRGTTYEQQVKAFTLEDFRWNAEQFNRIGKVVRDAGMQFGYHNHTMEFAAQSGVVPFDELLRLTDPALVTIEMDCGWVVVGGADPAEYLRRYPTRISMLHVKDFKRTEHPLPVGEAPPAAELGRGTLDYSSIFHAARKSNIQHYFVEQESFDIPPMDALRIDADYMKALKI